MIRCSSYFASLEVLADSIIWEAFALMHFEVTLYVFASLIPNKGGCKIDLD